MGIFGHDKLRLKFGLDKGFEYMAVIASFKVNFIVIPIFEAAFLVTTIIGTFFVSVMQANSISTYLKGAV